jgi:phosphoribosylanthranilate isomerase
MKIKFCGVCRAGDAEAAARLGADYVGVILSPGFPRSKQLDDAKVIYRAAGGTQKVGVFVDSNVNEITNAVQELGLDVVQLHGSEDATVITELRRLNPGIEIWKAKRVSTERDVGLLHDDFGHIADALLMDRNRDAQYTTIFPSMRRTRWVVAGGVTPQNVASIIRDTKPDVIDVSSGIEESLGKKSEAFMKQFIENARR